MHILAIKMTYIVALLANNSFANNKSMPLTVNYTMHRYHQELYVSLLRIKLFKTQVIEVSMPIQHLAAKYFVSIFKQASILSLAQ